MDLGDRAVGLDRGFEGAGDLPGELVQVASATKRITHTLREEMKRERDRMVGTQPRAPKGR